MGGLKISKKKYKTKFKIGQVQIGFTRKNITAYGGFSLIAAFFEKIGLSDAIKSIIPVREKSPNTLGLYSKVLSLFLTVLAGGERFSHLLYLSHGIEIFCRLFNIKRLPKASTTLTRFFRKIKSWQNAEKMAENLWDYLFGIIPWKKLKEDYLSFDSSVITRYGKQEGAVKGYNPKKPGRPSHHPILAFLSKSEYIVNLWNRAGNARSAENIVAFATQTCQRIKEKIGILGVLADSSFYNIDFIRYLEQNSLKYVVSLIFYTILQEKVLTGLEWRKVDKNDDVEIADFFFCHKDEKWDKLRRYFVVRKRVRRNEKMPAGKQLKLFPDLEETKNYRYSGFITNFEGNTVDLWRIYRQRCDDENRVKEIKEDFGFCGFSMKNFYATEAAMLMRVLLYNIYNLFRLEILSSKERNHRASTIRFKYWVIPAILGADGNQSILRLGVSSKKLRCKLEYLLWQISRWFPAGALEPQCI